MSDLDAWREWFQKNVQPRIDRLPVLSAPCPGCGLTTAEDDGHGRPTCAYCFICHGRDYCGCEEHPESDKGGTT